MRSVAVCKPSPVLYLWFTILASVPKEAHAFLDLRMGVRVGKLGFEPKAQCKRLTNEASSLRCTV